MKPLLCRRVRGRRAVSPRPRSRRSRRASRRLLSAEQLPQAFEEHRLRGVDPAARFTEREPLGAVDLGELAHDARPRWPLERKGVASHARCVEVAFLGPGAHELAAGLPGAAEVAWRDGRRRDTKLLLELAHCAGTRVLALLVLAFRD